VLALPENRESGMSKSGVWLALAAALLALPLSSGLAAAEPESIGYLENVRIQPGGIIFRAKIDTGARTSSLDVSDLVEFERDGKRWLHFTAINNAGRSVTLERPVERVAHIKRSGTATQSRYVVKLGICMGRTFAETEVNLNDREGMTYRLLIGRRFLADRFRIDASKKDLTKPECPESPKTGAPAK
jgi:hypothetical protein